MKSQKIFQYTTSFVAFIVAAFMIGSINQSIDFLEKSNADHPSVIGTYPSDGEDGIPRNVVIEVTFDETIDSESLQSSTFKLMQGSESVEGTFEYSGNKGMFTTEKSLKAKTEYQASLSVNSDQSNNDNSDNDYSDNEMNDDQNQEYEENDSQNIDREWSFTTGGNSEPVETVELGNAANYVILARSSILNDTSSKITGEKGYNPNFKSSKDKEDESAYWLDNKDVDKDEVREEKEKADRAKEEAKKEKEDMRRDANREMSDDRENSANEDDNVAGNLDEALEDMISAYNEAENRTTIDFVDYKLSEKDMNSSESDWNNEQNNQNDMNSSESRWDEEGQDDSEEDSQRDSEEDYDNEMHMDNNKMDSEMNRNRSESNMNRNTNESTVTLEPGIYKWNDSVEIATNITLSGNDDDVWIFQIPEGLTVNPNVMVTLEDGVVPENVIWQVGGEVSIGEASHFEGIILSLTEIIMKDGASLNGRLLAQTDVTLNDNTILEPQVFASARTSSNE